MGRSYPESTKRAFLDALDSGLTLKEIARRAGVKYSAAQYWCQSLGIRISGRVRDRVVAAYRPGMELSELARVSGASTPYVSSLAKKRGWKLTTQFDRAARLRDKILAEHKKGGTHAAVARRAGCSECRVSDVLIQAGIVRNVLLDYKGKTIEEIAAERGSKETSIRTRARCVGMRVEDNEIVWNDDLPTKRGQKAPRDAEYEKWIAERGYPGFRFPPGVWERYRACWQAHVEGKPDAFYSEPGTFGGSR